MRIVIRVKELVSNNVTTLVEKASNPIKMLRLLRTEIEESDIALHGEITKLTRQKDRAEAAAKKLEGDAKDWSDKAKLAMDHGREDLARSALLAREDAKANAEQQKVGAKNLTCRIAEVKDALEQLGTKLDETDAQLRKQEVKNAAGADTQDSGANDSNTDRRMDRIANLERRVDHSLGDQPAKAKSNATLDAEIASMRRAGSVDAELEKLRSAGKSKGGHKAG